MNRDIAIIGMAGRFPDAGNLDELYRNLEQGKDSIRDISRERLRNTGLPLDSEYIKAGYLENIDQFDHHLFNISRQEACCLEPVQRLLLEVVYEAMENSAYSVEYFNGSHTAVFVGCTTLEYYRHIERCTGVRLPGNAHEFLAARINRHFNLKGSAVVVDTLCSSSLTAVHLACNELILGEADFAVVCGANLYLFPFKDHLDHLEKELYSPDGKSRAFSAQANGMSHGEAAAAILLKPLRQALTDNDIIHAVIKGTAVNHNANRSATAAAPDSITQAEVIKKAWQKAGIDPTQIGYIEAHGSGTQIGDSLEIEGLTLAFKEYTEKTGFCPISTIKSNIGHSMSVSGLCSLIKAVLSLEYRILFPTIHFKTPNPIINFRESAVYVNKELKKWEIEKGGSRYAGVTSMGADGSNCHVVLQESPPGQSSAPLTSPTRGSHGESYLITVSSQTPLGLKANLKALQQKLSTNPHFNLRDISYTLNNGRKHYNCRFAAVADHPDALKDQIKTAVNTLILDPSPSLVPQKLIFMFSDHEEIPTDMLHYFVTHHEPFRMHFNQCKELMPDSNEKNSLDRFNDFAFQYSFFKLLAAYGITTQHILGVGIGKIINEVVSKRITLEQGLKKILLYEKEELKNLDQRVEGLLERETREGSVVFINMGPGSVLSRELESKIPGDEKRKRHFLVFHLSPGGETNKKSPFLELLKCLYISNCPIEWCRFYQHHQGQKIQLPGYQFEKTRCWLEGGAVENITPKKGNFYSQQEIKSDSDISFYLREPKSGDSRIEFMQLEKIPLTPAGQLDGESLPAPDISRVKLPSTDVEPVDDLEELITQIWKEVLELKQKQIDPLENFFDLGGNSLKILQVNTRLTEALGKKIPLMKLFKYPTINSLKEYLQEKIPHMKSNSPGLELQEQKSPAISDIGVIGMAGRFPGARNIDQFWENLENGIESISFFSREELKEEGVSSQLLDDANYIKARGIPGDKDRFDAAFFNYTPKEALMMDPQMRMFHECVWEALEDAGYNPGVYHKPIGLYAGSTNNIGWEAKVFLFARDDMVNFFETSQLTDCHFIPTRISYKLDLKGPALFIQTACSTSLSAVHTACNALLTGDCAMALAGGVYLSHEKKMGYLYQEGLVMSPDGHCRALDASAAGAVIGEGAAVVLLKPLEQTLKDMDHIYAVIKASAANNDGARKVGFPAPSIDGQAETIADVYRKAGIPTESVTYIETHGTGTILGDPVELEALKQAFNTQKKGFCALGSVKTNVGHLDSAAGVTGFIKAVMALNHKQIPASLNFETPNLKMDLINSPFYVNTGLAEWEPGPYPRRAAVSSFGIGGTNVHLVLEEPLSRESLAEETGEYRLILLSARTQTALDQSKKNLLDYLEENSAKPGKTRNPGLNLADIAYTLQVGRKAFNHRWMAVCSTVEKAIGALASPGQGETYVVSPGEESYAFESPEPAVNKSGLTRIGQLWLHGQEIDWGAFYQGEKCCRISLPTYPFEGQSYWIEGDPFDMDNYYHPTRQSPPVKKDDISDWFYLPRWTQAVLAASRVKKGKPLCFLVFLNQFPMVLELVERLRSLDPGIGHNVIIVSQGEAFQKKGDHEFVIDSRCSSDYLKLFTQLNRMGLFPHRIIHAWNVTGSHDQPVPGVVGPGFYSLLYLAKTLGKQDFEEEIRLDVLTTNIQEITGSETLIPEKAVVLGLLKVIPQEYPYIICRCIDIELPPAGGPQEERLAGFLTDEFLLDLNSLDTEIAYRSFCRWIKTYEPLPLEGIEKPLPLRDRGVYLITGGWGNIGISLAEYLVKQVGARLILTGTSHLPAREKWAHWLQTHDPLNNISIKIKRIYQLEAAGGEVLAFRADASDKDAMQKVIRESEKIFGPINAVIHAAGVNRDKSLTCTIEEVDEKECERHFRPKIQGTLVLARLFQNKPLDFCVLTSSLSVILGGLGFAAYSAANTFMDTFAHQVNRSSSTRWISMDLGDWGFLQERNIQYPTQMGASPGEKMINFGGGVETFKRILTLVPSAVSQVVVSADDLQARIGQWVKLRPLRQNDSTGPVETSSGQFLERPRLAVKYAAARTPMEKALARIWQHQLGIEKIGTRDDFFELGGDSLKAVTVISQIHKKLNVNVTLSQFFKSPTIEKIAECTRHSTEDKYISIKSVEKKEYYSLSSAQKRLFILQQIGIKTTAYNIPQVVILEGILEKKKIEKTFDQLIKRHESLRISFEMVCEEPVQRIHDEVDFEIENYQFEVKVEEIIDNFIRFFDLAQTPLLRVGLIKSSEKKHILMIDMHHIISDGVSQAIYVKELMHLYEGRELLPIEIRYKDYVEWKNSQVEQEAVKKQEEYWLKEFSAEIPVLNLPLDYKRPLIQSFEGNLLSFAISRKETKLLKNLLLKENLTLYMLLVGVYNIFLSKMSGQEEIVIGTPTAGRRLVELNQVIGMFVNTLALKNYPLGVKTCKDFLTEVKERTLQAFENQDFQFEDLVDRTPVSRDPGRNPLFDTMFALNNIVIDKVEITGLTLTPYENERNFSIFDLTLSAEEMEDRLCFDFEYCTKLFKKETIQRFIHYFKRIISSVIENPGKKIAEIEIITGEERKQLLYDFNASAADYPKDKGLHQLFQEQAAALPDHTILVWGEKQLTYKELNGKVNQLARLLRAKGLASHINAVVGLMVKPSPEMVVGVLGILKAGAAYLPIDPAYPEKRKKHMLKDSEAKLSICHDPGNDIGDSAGNIRECELINIGNDHFTGDSSDLEVTFTPRDLIYTIFTSGSTGKPKGVGVYHRSFLNLIYWYIKEFNLNANDSVLLVTSLSFDLTQKNLFAPLLTGGKLHLPEEDRYDPRSVSQIIWEKDITWLNCTPGMFYPLVEEDENFKKLASLRYVFLGGEPIALPLINRCWQADYFNAELVNFYGPTECTIVSSYYRIKLPGKFNEGLASIPIGKPISNVQLFVLDSYWHPQPLGVSGELFIGGEGLAPGYLNDISMTSEKFITISLGMNWRRQLYRTGDLVRWLPGGNLEFLGRIDQQLKIRGFRIELGEIESQLLKHIEINECLVVAPEDKTGDKYLCAYILSNRPLEISGLREYLAESLPGYMIPSSFVFLDRIPLYPNGKINRSALPVPQLKIGQKYTTPGNRIEERLVELWAELLGIEKSVIDIDGDFFELGGHSLKATVLAAKVHKQFHVKLPLAEIFKHPSIRMISQYIKSASPDKFFSIEPGEQKEYYPLSPAQKRLYIVQRMDPQSIGYNLPRVVILEGILEKDKLESIFKKLIQRHESMKTSFHIVNDVPVQRINETVEFEIDYYDMKEVEVKVDEERASVLEGTRGLAPLPIEPVNRSLETAADLINLVIRPFDLSRAPLMRVGLVKLPHTPTALRGHPSQEGREDKYLLVLDMHHIITDGISQHIWEKEFISLYHDRNLPPLTLQYKDYSEWQNSDEQKQALEQQEKYWLKTYQGEIPVLNLPVDNVRASLQSFEGSESNFLLDSGQTEKLRALALETGVTLYMVILAFYYVLLAKISGQEDIVVGTPVSGRTHSDLESIIGMFVNTLALRNYPSAEKTFTNFLSEVKQRTIRAFDNQDYPFEELVEKLGVGREAGRNPIFDVMFAYQTQQEQRLKIREDLEVKIEPYEYENRTSKFDMILNAVEEEHALHFNIEYSTKLFKKKTIERFAAYFKDIVTSVSNNHNVKLKDIEISLELIDSKSTISHEAQGAFGF